MKARTANPRANEKGAIKLPFAYATIGVVKSVATIPSRIIIALAALANPCSLPLNQSVMNE
jgi:hypothetical protein